ncbi:glycosyltransferase family 1 protein [bacterium]|nr:MAG: glycosyltransferase family 1 protein [bacterium]
MPVLLTADFPPSRGGIQRYMSALAQALHDDGHAVAVVAPGERQTHADAGLSYPVLRYGEPTRWSQPARMYDTLVRAHRLISDGRTICSSWYPAGLAAAFYHRWTPARLAILAHGSEIAPGASPLRLALQRAVFARAGHRIANSRFTAGLLARAGIVHGVDVVACGVDAWSIARRPATEPTILSVGRLIARKGFDRVIAALPALKRRLPGVRYEIVGDGPQREELLALAERLGVREHVQLLGALDDAALHDAYGRAWCFALPARSEGNDVEGFGIVYLEAALAALPAIGGRGSGAEDALLDGVTGLLIDGNDVPALTRALTRLLIDRPWALSLGLTARRRALACYTWSHTAKRLAALLGLSKETPLRCSA